MCVGLSKISSMANYLMLFVAIVLTVAAQLLLKRGVANMGDIQLSVGGLTFIVVEIFRNLYLFFGLFLLGLTFLLWIWLVSKVQLNILYPITVSGQLALLALGSWLWFNEVLTPMQLLGMAIIIVGIFLLSWAA